MPPLIIWLTGVSFLLFQFFIQLSSGVVIDSISKEMVLSALTTGILSSAFYYIYAGLQIPIGLLFDIKNTRSLLTMGAVICSLGCFLFAESYSFSNLILARLILGGGAAFAFIGLSHLLRTHFSAHHFAFMIGLSETLAFLTTMVGTIGLGLLIHHFGWRLFLLSATGVGLSISLLCWFLIPSHKPSFDLPHNQLKQLGLILSSKKLWINGFFVGLTFSVVTVFGAMWAVPFAQIKLGCSLQEASVADAMFFCGAALSCPLFGYLSNHYKRRLLMLISCLSTAVLMSVILYLPINSLILLSAGMFGLGTCCGAYMLAYSIANDLAPPNSLSTCTGFTNTLAMLSAPLMQPLIGFTMDKLNPSGNYLLIDYQYALLSIPLALLVASFLVFFLPE